VVLEEEAQLTDGVAMEGSPLIHDSQIVAGVVVGAEVVVVYVGEPQQEERSRHVHSHSHFRLNFDSGQIDVNLQCFVKGGEVES
jgi:tetrahydrodipicolinate N-succinyltransferase